MRAELLTIGDELCRGEIIDTNGAWLAAQLWDLSVTVGWMTSCRDVAEDIRAALTTAAARSDIILVSGGLGPTVDDLTVDVVAEMAGVTADVHEPSLERMKRRFEKAAFRLTPNNLRQVRAPAGATVYGNPAGLAPGFEISLSGTPVVCMPGVPREMKAIFRDAVEARIVELREARGERVERIARRIFRVFGMGESHIAAALEGVGDGVDGASIHYQVKFPENLVKVVVKGPDQAAADAALDGIDADIRLRLGDKMYGTGTDELPVVVGAALREAGATVVTAESCTGGMVGMLLTAVPGSSAYFLGGAVTYSNAEKVRQLGVASATLDEHGAVSEACVLEMARGARDRFGADYAVAVSGVAGPDGGSEEKPVGTVWLAVAGPRGEHARHMVWPSDRDRVRGLAAHAALAMVLRAVRSDA